tara:strand:+ start:250 stop:669 length:420 start_codon:yes stop_codon:yes gene_type:complete
MSFNDENKLIILFDGICNLCIGSIQFIIKKDSKDIFRLASIQSEVGQKIIKKYSIDIVKKDSIILINGNNITYQSTAIFSILYKLNTFWRILLIFYILPYPIRDYIYSLVAKSRYSLFGKQNTCIAPNKNIKSKFLNIG